MPTMLAAIKVIKLLNKAEWTAIIKRGLVNPLDLLVLAQAHLGDGKNLSGFFQEVVDLINGGALYSLHPGGVNTSLLLQRWLRRMFQPCQGKELWALFLFAKEILVNFEFVVHHSAFAWLPVALLSDRKLASKALDVMRDSDSAWLFVSSMIAAQSTYDSGAHVITLSPREKTCNVCPLASQRAWPAAIAWILTSLPDTLGKLPVGVVEALRAKSEEPPGTTVTFIIEAHPANCPNLSSPCATVANPHLELVQLLMRTETEAKLRSFAGNTTGGDVFPRPEFWHTVPVGALDGVLSVSWIARAVYELKVGGGAEAKAAIREIRRVAPTSRRFMKQ
ncbi:hypothetical protein H9P43_007390 [Blastocladiella emersonii ATCC 22665]|nr:hypothetical protein H9P43_007390 [Blastocladiella emersonii ATCC 22665]